LELANEQGIMRFENYFKDIAKIRKISDLIADKIEKIFNGEE